MPQHVIFAFRFQNELARVFFWGQNELAQFSSEGGFELALFFFWADFGFLLGPFRASSLSWLYLPGPNEGGYRTLPKHRRTRRKKPGDGVDRVEGLKRCSEGLDGSTSFGTSGPVRT